MPRQAGQSLRDELPRRTGGHGEVEVVAVVVAAAGRPAEVFDSLPAGCEGDVAGGKLV